MGEFARASDELMQEHRLIERVLDALETATLALEGGRTVRPEFFLEAARLVTTQYSTAVRPHGAATVRLTPIR